MGETQLGETASGDAGKSAPGKEQANSQPREERHDEELPADAFEAGVGESCDDRADVDEAEADHGLTLEAVSARLAEAEQECRKAQEQSLRAQAEMQNLRLRAEHDIQKAHKFGQERFSSELLVVIDNLERAAAAASEHEHEAVKAIHEGVNLTLKSFIDCFAKFHIEAVDPQGEPFDPELHQAMSLQENGEVEPNTVIAVMQKGYTLHGRVLRPAMVVVSTEPAGDADN